MATSGPDILRGTSDSDEIFGRGGDDLIFGYDGEQTKSGVGTIKAELVTSGLSTPVFAGAAPGRPDELFVLQKNAGQILILDPATGASSVFLDIPDGELSTSGEQGLLGLAFHPDYASNGRFFVHLVNAAGDIEIREYVRSAGDADVATAAPVQTIITIPHPTNSNHNGGAIAFGPNDGYLYIAMGDGGGGNDPNGHGQNTDTLLGAILRLDVDDDDFALDDDRNYAIPDDNPFVDVDGADEIWAYGLRNPWRISFDTNGDLYIADVGQSAREEINVQAFDSIGGENYGWSEAEGTLGDPPPGSVLPVFEYGRELGRSVTGGHVLRGDEASLEGAYFFADFASGRIWTLNPDTGATERTTQIESSDGTVQSIASFGLDGAGKLYIVSLSGNIFRLDPAKHAGDLADTLRGGNGNDSVYGGPGDDALFGNAGADRLTGGHGDDQLKGGKGEDKVFGNRGDDTLAGGKDRDTLKGGRGEDSFVFDAKLGGGNIDRIADFKVGSDRIGLDRDIFKGIGAVLNNKEFHIGKKAADADDRIIYNKNKGHLIYDKNGSESGGAKLFARLDKKLDLDHQDFYMGHDLII